MIDSLPYISQSQARTNVHPTISECELRDLSFALYTTERTFGILNNPYAYDVCGLSSLSNDLLNYADYAQDGDRGHVPQGLELATTVLERACCSSTLRSTACITAYLLLTY